ncbi:serine/threonine-protein kinase-like protein CCR4 [Phoenix dactylifera]|uniref:Serine/threonine-protein kinase-like protein CCR4 n=1 Tax=Phoenix dactylifera TaxID=42345 RepID=A0A8B9AV67_PHODC|nr:serine/threonine-protein kinase-like protein CCR4 [Phoenix dactylifera]
MYLYKKEKKREQQDSSLGLENSNKLVFGLCSFSRRLPLRPSLAGRHPTHPSPEAISSHRNNTPKRKGKLPSFKHLSRPSPCYNDIPYPLNLPSSFPMSLPDHSPLLLLVVLFLLVTIPTISCHLSTVAISHVSNQTIVCALLHSHTSKQFDLNCTSIAKRVQRNYPSANNSSYTAIAAGDGFLCALGWIPVAGLSTMRWWEFKQESGNSSNPKSKRVYRGSPLVSLSAGDTHVCGLQEGSTRKLDCWRWPQLVFPEELNFTDIAVGADFVCGLLSVSQQIQCFGNDSTVVSLEPNGSYVTLAAGSQHACAVSKGGELVCWGIGAPEVERNPFEIGSLALGENRTCALSTNGAVKCWGENSQLPNGLSMSQFVAIEAKGSALCGVLMANYSLVCWGNEIFKPHLMVFNRVLPGSCVPMSTCPCGVLAGSANICGNGAAGIAICGPCRSARQANPPPPPPPPPLPPTPPSSGSGRRRLVFIVIGSVSLAVVLLAAAIWFIILPVYRNNGRIHDTVRLHAAAAAAAPLPPGVPSERVRPNVEAFSNLLINRQLSIGHSSTIKEFPLAALLAATDNFSDDHKIGSGGFGLVYRAVLDDGRVVAIKRAEPPTAAAATSSTSHADRRRRDRDREAAFLSELALLSRVNHKNLVRLLGFCNQDGERILVYEFMPNGTLHDHLHKLAVSPLASWAARLRVALDAARGIEYLHAYAVPPIIHRDIKSSNILLDATWTAKVADFGLSLLSPSSDDEDTRDLSSPRAAGTVGYMDPQYYRLQHLTTKSDVYSFGVVLLELLTGCRAVHRNDDSGTPTNLVEYAVPHIDADDVHRVMDRRLPPPTPSEIETVAFVGYLAADCVSPDGTDRPTMTEIVSGLERAMAACAGQAPPALSRSATARSF